MKKKIIAKNKEHLKKIINKEISLNGFNCNLNHIDISNIKNLSFLFFESQFNGDISEWDVSNVNDMNGLFQSSMFSGDISNWKPYKVDTFLLFTFDECPINIPYWATYEIEEERNKAIDKYHLAIVLANKLPTNDIQQKKLKL